ncbi:MAG: multiheme c-type cytochrome ExtKL [Desulfobulbaceae bacterium]
MGVHTKRITTLLAGMLLLALLQSAYGKEAKSIDELVSMFDSSKCGECHEEIYRQWQDSWHSKAIVSSLKGMRNFISVGLAQEWNTALTKNQVLKCLDCHAPVVNYASEELAVKIGQMIVTAFDKKDTPEGEQARKELARLNVGCLACHNIKATAVARGLRGAPEENAVYGPTGAESDGHKTIETVDITRSVFCMQCHGIYKAADGETIQCNTLSGSYQNTYVNLGGSETCQDCHMKKGHLFPGGHDLETVKEGLGFDVEISPYRHLPGQVPDVKDKKKWVPSVVVTAFVENLTGHRVPDG